MTRREETTTETLKLAGIEENKRMRFPDRVGEGLNNTMSLWTFPWTPNRRSLKRPNKHKHLRFPVAFHSNKTKYALLVVVLVFCVGFLQVPGSSPGQPHQALIKQGTLKQSGELSLAVLVAGSTERFLFDSFVKHVAHAPLSGAPVHIDYFAILTMKSGPAFRQDDGYMGHLAGHDKSNGHILATSEASGLEKTQKWLMNAMAIAVMFSAKKSKTIKTNIVALRLLEEPIEDDPVLDRAWSRERHRFEDEQKSGTKHEGMAGFDLFRQFPMMDKREKALGRTHAGNKNMIRMFLALESLYKTEFLTYENTQKQKLNQQPAPRYYYDYVLILRDDTLWLGDFDLHKVIATDPTADAYILSCDARDPKMLPPEINDHGILIRRDKAMFVGEYVSTMAALDLQECHDSVTEWVGEERGCNSEMILKYVLEKHKIKVKLVPQSLLPFERSVLIDGKSAQTGDDFYCYHKFCQSVDEPLELPSEIQRCKELSFSS